jgi:hypothetical protein
MQQVQPIDPKGSFLKNLILSLVLIGLSSLLIPVVLKQIDDQKFVAEQQFQEQLARQDKIIDAQAALLDSLASTFWDYEIYASDVVYSRDERFGRDGWHQQAMDAYYEQAGPLLGKMRAEISTLLRLAPRPSYEAFLRLYEDEVLALDSCLLELMKFDAASFGTPQPSGTPPSAAPQPPRCVASEGKFAGASWDTLNDYVLQQDLAANADREFEALAKAFGLQGAAD